MSRQEYLKLLEKEIQLINKRIDHKILQGEDYAREARDHRILLRKIRQHTHRSFLSKFFPSFAYFQ